MINRKLFLVAIIFTAIFIAVFFLSSRVPQRDTQNERIHIVTSFYPLSHIAKSIGGNIVDVRNLVPAGVEPHDFEPSSRDLVEIGNADALFYNGASLESWIKKWNVGISVKPKYVVNMEESL
ncbi:MAG: ABC-type metal ion transport system, periplasmic component/surface adhesin, partial [Candidatus Nomurabacteria bacterium GW2011_GWD1_44_10]